MIITKVFNNNVVSSITNDGQETILFGIGIGFQKRKGDVIDESKIKKSYFLQDVKKKKVYNFLEKVPIEYLELAEVILLEASNRLGRTFSQGVLLSLADHIAFAVQRAEEGWSLPNLIKTEIIVMYPVEYELGNWAVNYINEQLHITLDDEEKGYIAVHIVNATSQDVQHKASELLNFIHDIVHIIERHFGIKLEENVDNLNYTRLVTHLKFFILRIMNQMKEQSTEDLDQMLKRINEDVFGEDKEIESCLDEISTLIEKEFNYTISENEKVFLTIHIVRLLNNL